MKRPDWLDNLLYNVIDTFFAIYPQPVPTKTQLQSCKIISHRGERDDKTVFENTFDAFDPLLDSGVWGIEFDIRWTKDLVPVVFHDVDCKRLFDSDLRINDTTFEEVRQTFPVIPSLEEFINRYGKKLHLFIELKKENYPEHQKQQTILENILKQLTPVEDYHFLALHPDMFDYVSFAPKESCLPVADINTSKLSRIVHEKGYGGITGYYLTMSKAIIQSHLAKNKRVGVGFVASRNGLCRELNRGIDLIFSNNALGVQRILAELVEVADTPKEP